MKKFLIDSPPPKKDKEEMTPASKPARKKGPKKKWLRIFQMIANAIMLAVNSAVALGLLISSYAQTIAPSRWGVASAITMTFGWWFAACVLIFILDLIWWRRTAWIAGMALLVCVGPIHDFCPLNIPRFGMGEEEKARSFSIMTYNAFKFYDYREKGARENRQLDYILKAQPDVVCIQEADYLSPTANKAISQRQLDSIHIIYPYVLTDGAEFAILSKFEAKPINLNFPTDSFSSGDMTAWRLYIDERVVNVFSVHLRSFNLSDSDKSAYKDMLKPDNVNRAELREVKNNILPKIRQAAIEREGQIEYLEKYLAKYGGTDAIVCGDFNDPVGGYPLYSLERVSKMRQAYSEAGFGPAITYNANYLFYRIDHILYRGNMRPWSIRRCGVDASDHYPLMATFILE